MIKFIESIIFKSRFLLVPFYIGLIIGQVIYLISFIKILFLLILSLFHLEENESMIHVLQLVDAVMVANLIWMITNGYQNFVNKIEADKSEKIGSGLLKVKMGSSLIGICLVDLLSHYFKCGFIEKCIILVIFLTSTLVLAYIDYLHKKIEIEEKKHEH